MRLSDLTPVPASATGWGPNTRRQLWGGPSPKGLSRDDYELSPLPSDAQWFSGSATVEQVAELYHRCDVYQALSGNTLRIADSALMVTGSGDRGRPQALAQADRVRELVRSFDPEKLTPLHLGSNDVSRGPFNVLDGNCRAVALLLLHGRGALPLRRVPLFVVTSPGTSLKEHVGRQPDGVLAALRG